MKTLSKSVLAAVALAVTMATSSCLYTEDPGPLQDGEREFGVTGFDKLEMGSAFVIEVRRADAFSVQAYGDERNLDDLEVFTDGTKLVIRFEDHQPRKHTTYLNIAMPELKGVNFSGASNAEINGFDTEGEADIRLSGASVAHLDMEADELKVSLSGASTLTVRGQALEMNANLSGASVLKAFEFPVNEADVDASGASKAQVLVTNHLKANASGASSVVYRGDASVDANSSGGSSIKKD